MQQKKETNYTEVISMEEYLTKRRKARAIEKNERRGGIPKENHALVLAELYI